MDVFDLVLSKRAIKDLKGVPVYIVEQLKLWGDLVESELNIIMPKLI